MINFAKFIVNAIEDPDAREEIWMNAPNHLTGDHSHPYYIKRKPRKVKKCNFRIWQCGVDNLNVKHADNLLSWHGDNG